MIFALIPVSSFADSEIPDWLKQVAEFWISDQIDDEGFVQVIEYLVQQEIITIPNAESPEDESAASVPGWIKSNAEFWVKGELSNDEFAVGLEWLINNGIIKVAMEKETIASTDETGTNLSGEVTIGLILPLTGDLAHKGHENWEGSKFGVEEFNKYLKEIGESWQLKLISEDSATSPVVALEKLTSLKAKGIDIVVGPETSSNIRNIKGYADSNNMLLFSCCSTAPALAIPNDSVFRLVPNDTFQGTALAKKVQHDGIEVLVPIWRGDAWGDGLRESTVKSINERGLAASDGVRYNPESPEFSASVSLLASQVDEQINQYGKDKVAVGVFGFGETVNIMQAASQHDILDEIKWYGGDSNVKEIAFIEDPIASEFANKVVFSAAQFSIGENDITKKIDAHVLEALGREGYAYINTSYDVVWILGLSILEAKGTDVDDIKEVLPKVAENYSGALDSVRLNEAGDLSGANYGVWSIIDNKWVLSDLYNFETDSITTPAEEGPKLSGEVTIGLILPLTGDLATHGIENHAGSEFGVEEFNKHLEEIGESWHLKMISEDSATNPVIALEKLTSLNAKGIGLVVGPETSSNIRNIKGYSDSNNMLLVSCCSSAPALAIPNDSVFRLVPDDRNQGTALAKLIQHEGIEVLVPVWRGDTWGDGLSEATTSSFLKRGGQTDEGVRYNPESPEFSASTSFLASSVSKYVEEYGEDKVAVLFLGFAEILQFMQSASEHDVLNDVRWFGPGANTKEHKLIDDPIGLEFSTNVQFTTVQFAASKNPIYEKVQEHLTETLGTDPNTFVHSSYDAVWIIGLSILETQSSDVSIIKAKISEIADNYSGAIGPTKLNEAGDLAQADYEVWGIRGAEWVLLGKYTQSEDSITLN